MAWTNRQDCAMAFTLRPTDEQAEALAALAKHTGQARRSEAIWQAVREYPALDADRARLRGRIEALAGLLARAVELREARAQWEAEAAAALAEAGGDG